MRFDLQAQIYINCGFAKINYLILNIAVHFYKESNELKSLVLCSTADFSYNFNYTSTRREKYLRYDVVQPAKEPHIKSTG